MGKKQFQSESKRLLELMVNSIYTHKEIFLREIISNASDAIDKLCYISLTDDKVGMSRDDFKITVETDSEARTITVTDNGIGMTAEELESNLGVIARSGSLQFKKEMESDKPEDVDIIGQFGVGFYSAFMVSSRVTVLSRAYGHGDAHKWESSGSDGYTVTRCDKDAPGTVIIMELKPDTEDEKYSEYLEEYTLHSIIKKYSDYIRWPIIADVTKSRQVETDEAGSDGKKKKTWEDYTEKAVINSRVPIWQRAKGEVSDADCAEFYKEKFFDMEDPAAVIRVSAEGTVSYNAMLFIPSKAPYDYYTREYKAGLQLYTSGVMIMEYCSDLLPEHFRFVRGVVDSPDVSLNISRELLQHDRQLRVMRANIEKKVKAELLKLMENDPEKYETFFKSFGAQLKYGIMNGYGINKDLLSELIMFYSSKAQKLVSLTQYVKDMPEEQKYIYYACGDSIQMLDKLPQAERVLRKEYAILYMTDSMDEFVVKTIGKFEEKEFRSVNDDELGLESEDEKKEAERRETENRELLDFIKDSLDGKVSAVKLSHKLQSHPVCLTTQGGVSLEMERYFASLQGEGPEGGVRAERVLEINAGHPIFETLKKRFSDDRDALARFARLLHGQALIFAGLPLDDPADFSDIICSLME
ncbi:MAG: molecular chaperone HtpG [Oscillospiraceae bacterium]|jgi:molecular chaperone HtpG|nr:molecular chaperone HtpG [Oscillospiraceae bacterium]